MHKLTGFARGFAPLILAICIVLSWAVHVSAFAQSKITVRVEEFSFDRTDPDKTRFGDLEWRGGLVLSSDDHRFGGISGIVLNPEGNRLIGVSDIGRWVTADLHYNGRHLTGFDNVTLSRILGASGERLNGKVERDSEGLGWAVDGDILVAFERYHRVARYDIARTGFKARATYLDTPDEVSKFSTNKGFESVGQFVAPEALAGQYLVIAERFLDSEGHHSGWLLRPEGPRRLSFARSGEFDITDLEILPDGHVVLLERRFSVLFGLSMRLRLIEPEEFSSDQPIAGRVILNANSDKRIDNMEGLASHVTPEGETVLTIISDDNFRDAQRTLIMQFAFQENGQGLAGD